PGLRYSQRRLLRQSEDDTDVAGSGADGALHLARLAGQAGRCRREISDGHPVWSEADGGGRESSGGLPGDPGPSAQPSPPAGRLADEGGRPWQGAVQRQGTLLSLPPGRRLHLEDEPRREAGTRRQSLRAVEPSLVARGLRSRPVSARWPRRV